MNSAKKVSNFYDSNVQAEWERLERHPIELGVTLRYMDEYYPPNSSVLDVGGGPGRYAILLSQKGFDVTLVDISENNVKFAKQKAEEENANIKAICANALHLDKHVRGSFDIVQCMGPLYHLPGEKERILVVEQCLNLLKPGGLFVASFISSYAFLSEAVSQYPDAIAQHKSTFMKAAQSNVNIESDKNPGFTDAYFIHPLDIAPFMENFPVEKLVVAGLEGLPGFNERALTECPNSLISDWIDISYNMSQDKLTWAASQHFIYIGRKNG